MRRFNNKIIVLNNELLVIDVIQLKRIHWLCHLEGMEMNREIKYLSWKNLEDIKRKEESKTAENETKCSNRRVTSK